MPFFRLDQVSLRRSQFNFGSPSPTNRSLDFSLRAENSV
jgi:hypothetical protein